MFSSTFLFQINFALVHTVLYSRVLYFVDIYGAIMNKVDKDVFVPLKSIPKCFFHSESTRHGISDLAFTSLPSQCPKAAIKDEMNLWTGPY